MLHFWTRPWFSQDKTFSQLAICFEQPDVSTPILTNAPRVALCSTRLSLQTWRTWPSASGRCWWPRSRWRSTRTTRRCWWTSSTAWPSPTPAPPSCARPGWTAWPAFTIRTATSLRCFQAVKLSTRGTKSDVLLLLSQPEVCLLHLQAAMCYVHVAALVAEYLWRKGEFRRFGRGIGYLAFPVNNHCNCAALCLSSSFMEAIKWLMPKCSNRRRLFCIDWLINLMCAA